MSFLVHAWFWLLVFTLFILAHGYERRAVRADRERPGVRPPAARDARPTGQSPAQSQSPPRHP